MVAEGTEAGVVVMVVVVGSVTGFPSALKEELVEVVHVVPAGVAFLALLKGQSGLSAVVFPAPSVVPRPTNTNMIVDGWTH